ncbi:MAG: hypothetical protein E4H10_07260 [Bacteroidia bacterium]|nr:MAG: hypothetical protein E4H10_07260 [Bacteroidia bacterium]
MKIKSFLMILCLFIGAASIQLSAQSANRTYQYWYEWSFSTPVSCEGEAVDVLSFDMKAHVVVHVKDDVVVRHIEQIKGEATSSMHEGETFKYREIDTYISGTFIHFHFNAKGDMGTHYIGTMTVDISGEEDFTTLRLVCN